MSGIQLGLNPIWLIPCVLLALGFSLFLYFRTKSVWDSKWNLPLSILRFVGVFFVLFLMLTPLIKTIDNQVQKPKIHLLIDDSKSVGIVSGDKKQEIVKTIKNLKSQFEESVDVEVYGLEKEIKKLDSLSFETSVTNVSAAIKELSTQSASEHHVATVLVSDGVVNQGIGLDHIVSRKPVFTLGIGDTTEKKDVAITELFVNESTYKGNEFPLQTSILAKGYKGKSAKVKFIVDGKVVKEERIAFESNKDLIDLSFRYTSSKSGYLKLAIEVETQAEELTTENNTKSAYILVKESRKKIAIVSQSPHPDIKAIRSAVESLDKYEIKLVNLSFNKNLPKIADFDAFILHQLPCRNCSNESFVAQIFESDKPRWVIAGAQSDFYNYGKYIQSVELSNVKGVDLVSGTLNSTFDLFQTKDLDFSWLTHAPPMSVPFATITARSESQTLFEQKVGSVSNGKPLFIYSNKGAKEVLTLGEGLWKWRLFEQLELGKSTNFDVLVSKVVGLLEPTSKTNQLIVKSQKTNYLIAENPSFSVTVKNNLGELVYDNPIKLIINRNDSLILSTAFKVSESNPFYKGSHLTEGVYNYTASTVISGKTFKDYGTFSVSNLQLESKNLQADFEGLRQLAVNTGGAFYPLDKIDNKTLISKLTSFPNKIISQEYELLFNDMFWPLLLILLLFCTEWLARKLLGDV